MIDKFQAIPPRKASLVLPCILYDSAGHHGVVVERQPRDGDPGGGRHQVGSLQHADLQLVLQQLHALPP